MTNFAFAASTGRTATMFIAATLNSLNNVVGLHEGQTLKEPHHSPLPLINYQNRKAWHDPAYATRIVNEKRSKVDLAKSADNCDLLFDAAYYNASILEALIDQYPTSQFIVLFRRCEAFVRSATIVEGEDLQPAGWPDNSKPLSDREKFISIGRLKPHIDSIEAEHWATWSGIQRNIWLWTFVNTRLLHIADTCQNCTVIFYEDLISNSELFWRNILTALNLLSDSNLKSCIAASRARINQRTRYQIGEIVSWRADEIDMYNKVARILEGRLYDRIY